MNKTEEEKEKAYRRGQIVGYCLAPVVAFFILKWMFWLYFNSYPNSFTLAFLSLVLIGVNLLEIELWSNIWASIIALSLIFQICVWMGAINSPILK